MGFNSVDEVQQYFAENGEEKLMTEVRSGRHGGRSMDYFVEWQASYEIQSREKATEMTRRAVIAAEKSAEASKFAARLSALGSFIALLTVLVMAAKEWGWF